MSTAPSPSAAPAAAPPSPEFQALMGRLEREVKALGPSPKAAPLLHEMGQLWEQLRQLRNASICYEAAHRFDPTFLPNIRSARRILAEVNNWPVVLQLLDAEIAATTEPVARGALRIERAQLLEERLAKPAEALATWEQALAERPDDTALLHQLERMATLAGDHAKRASLLEKLAAKLTDERLAAHLLHEAALLQEQKLADPAKALALFERAHALRPRDPVLAAAVKQRAERSGSTDALLKALATEAEALGAHAGPAFHRVSRTLERQGRIDEAVAALISARRLAPNDTLVLSELARLLESAGRWSGVVEVLQAQLEAVSGIREKVSLGMRLASVLDENLHQDEAAAEALRAVLALSPGHAPALTALGRLCHRRGDWLGLRDTLDREAAALADPVSRHAAMFKAAEVLEQRLSMEDEAIGRYQQLLELDPDHLAARKALLRLLELRGRWDLWARLREAEAAKLTDNDEWIDALHELATVYADRLLDPDRAESAYRHVLERVPEHLATVRALCRLLERTHRWEALIVERTKELSRASTTEVKVTLLQESARILEERLRDDDASLVLWQKVRELLPGHLPALQAMGRLFHRAERWKELVEMYRAEAQAEASVERATGLTFKAGQVLLEKLNDSEGAIGAFREVLTLSPAHDGALRALAAHYRSKGESEQLVEVLRMEAAVRDAPTEHANLLFQVATVWEDADKNDLAIEAYKEALTHVPGHAAATRALERLHAATGDHAALANWLESEAQSAADPVAGAAAWLRLGLVAQYVLQQPQRAVTAYEKALALDPDHLEALQELETLKLSDPVARNGYRLRLAEQVREPHLSASWLANAAMEFERQGKGDAALLAWKTAHQRAPDNARFAWGLEATLWRRADHAAVAELLEARQSREPLQVMKLARAMRLARLAEGPLAAPDRALAAYRNALELSPGFLPAQRGIAVLLEKRGDLAALRELLREESAGSQVKADALAGLQRCVELSRKLNDADGLIADLRALVALDPTQAAAQTELEERLAEKAGGAGKVQLQLKRAEQRLAAGARDEAARAFFEVAETLLKELNDRPAALQALERSVAAQPRQPDVLERYAELAVEAGRHVDAAKALTLRMEFGGPQLPALRWKLALLLHDTLNDPDRAAPVLQQVLLEQPQNVEALTRVAAMLAKRRLFPQAIEAYRRLAELDTSPGKALSHQLRVAQLHDEAGELPNAAVAYRRVLEQNPNEPGVLDRLVAIYEQANRPAELVALIEQQASQSSGPTASALRVKTATLHLGLRDSPKAIAALRLAVDAEPTTIEPRLMLADLLAREPNQTVAAIAEYRALLAVDPFRVEAYHALFRLYDAGKQVDRQLCIAQLLQFFRQANELEQVFATDARGRVPQETQERLSTSDLETLLLHPGQRSAMAYAIEAIGDQLSKIYPADLEKQGLGRSDKLKPESPLVKPFKSICTSLGIEKFELYQGKRGAQVTLENSDPQSVVFGPDLVRKHQTREQKFLMARAALGLRLRNLLAFRLDEVELIDLVGAAVKRAAPSFAAFGSTDADFVKKVGKAISREAIKTLEGLAPDLEREPLQVPELVEAMGFSADRAGLLYCGDVSAALGVVLREDPQQANGRLDSFEQLRGALAHRRDVLELIQFAISDDFFRLRQKMRLGI